MPRPASCYPPAQPYEMGTRTRLILRAQLYTRSSWSSWWAANSSQLRVGLAGRGAIQASEASTSCGTTKACGSLIEPSVLTAKLDSRQSRRVNHRFSEESLARLSAMLKSSAPGQRPPACLTPQHGRTSAHSRRWRLQLSCIPAARSADAK